MRVPLRAISKGLDNSVYIAIGLLVASTTGAKLPDTWKIWVWIVVWSVVSGWLGGMAERQEGEDA